MRKIYTKTTTFLDGGKKIQAYTDQDKLRSTIGQDRKLTPEMFEHLKEKIVWLKVEIQKVQEVLDLNKLPDTMESLQEGDHEPLSEWERLMFMLYQDECRIDLREDEHLIEYKGFIPKHIDERCIVKASKVYDRYRKLLGNEKFKQLKEDVDTHFREDVIVDIDPSTGGGKI